MAEGPARAGGRRPRGTSRLLAPSRAIERPTGYYRLNPTLPVNAPMPTPPSARPRRRPHGLGHHGPAHDHCRCCVGLSHNSSWLCCTIVQATEHCQDCIFLQDQRPARTWRPELRSQGCVGYRKTDAARPRSHIGPPRRRPGVSALTTPRFARIGSRRSGSMTDLSRVIEAAWAPARSPLPILHLTRSGRMPFVASRRIHFRWKGRTHVSGGSVRANSTRGRSDRDGEHPADPRSLRRRQ